MSRANRNQSNRHCYADGYHTEHHLNPLSHWRDLPVRFLQKKRLYSKNSALLLHGLDWPMLCFRLFTKDYETLARHMVPVGDEQMAMSLEERKAWMQSLVQPFSIGEINQIYRK